MADERKKGEYLLRILVVGGAGFVGKYLIDHLVQNGWSVCVSKLSHERYTGTGVCVRDLDILDKSAILALLKECEPDGIFHLAAQSSVGLSWKEPALTVDVNIKGTINLLEAVREWGVSSRVLLLGSGEEYGHVMPEEIPLSEDAHLRPGNVYAATKACQNMLGKIYANAYGMNIVMVRAFNHIGPGQPAGFVIPDFCRQIAQIEVGLQEPVIKVGNIDAKRDFTDVEDVVRAYCLLMTRAGSGELYNVGSGKAVAIRQLLDMLLEMSRRDICVEIDKERFRPLDQPIIEADICKITTDVGWVPQIPIQVTLEKTLDFWRKQVKAKGYQ